MSVTTRLVWTFRCDRCQHHAMFGNPGVHGDEPTAPRMAEMLQTLTSDGWTILISPGVHKIVCPMHTDTLVAPKTQENGVNDEST